MRISHLAPALLVIGTSREEYRVETQIHARRQGKTVQVFVQVPAGLPVEITDSSGDMEIERMSDNARIENDSSGDIPVAAILSPRAGGRSSRSPAPDSHRRTG